MSDWLASLYGIAPYLGLFLSGLLGGVHCLGMCGGIVGALSINQSTPIKPKTASHSQLPVLLGYNLGRLSSYALAGVLAAGLGETLLTITDSAPALLNAVKYISALMMIALGLYIANIWHGVAHIERLGKVLWHHIEPFGRKFMPVNSFAKALPFGLVWGWLPCGLVYTALLVSMSMGSALEGGLMMLAFGLGTLPNLLLIGLFSHHLLQWRKKPIVAITAGGLISLMGVFMLFR